MVVPGNTPDEVEIRQRILNILESILGYQPEADGEDLQGLDSLQILELLVTLEDELDVDSDRIIESRPGWWETLDGLVEIIKVLQVGEMVRPDLGSSDGSGTGRYPC